MIPKPFVSGMIGSASDRGLQQYRKDDPHSWYGYRTSLLNESPIMSFHPFSLMPPLIKETAEVLFNYDTFRGRDIVPDYLRTKYPESPLEWYDDNTAKWAKFFSEIAAPIVEMSPKKIEHFFRGPGGTVGGIFLDSLEGGITTVGEGTGLIKENPSRLPKEIAEYPIVKGVLLKTYPSMGRDMDYVSALTEKVTSIKTEYDDAKKGNRPSARAVDTTVRRIKAQLDGFNEHYITARGAIKKIKADRTMSDAVKAGHIEQQMEEVIKHLRRTVKAVDSAAGGNAEEYIKSLKYINSDILFKRDKYAPPPPPGNGNNYELSPPPQ